MFIEDYQGFFRSGLDLDADRLPLHLPISANEFYFYNHNSIEFKNPLRVITFVNNGYEITVKYNYGWLGSLPLPEKSSKDIRKELFDGVSALFKEKSAQYLALSYKLKGEI